MINCDKLDYFSPISSVEITQNQSTTVCLNIFGMNAVDCSEKSGHTYTGVGDSIGD